MSNTRHAVEGGALRQERFASSQEYERGLMANLVAKRCGVLERADERELIWFVQLLSHQPGGIKKLAAELMAQFPGRIATDSMRKFGVRAGQVYIAEQVRAARDEVTGHAFPLKGEIILGDGGMAMLIDQTGELQKRLQEEARTRARLYPSKYPASEFVNCCQAAAAAGLEKQLLALCLDPAMPVADGSPWYFPTLVSTLREFQSQWIAARRPAVVTAIGEKVYSALDYSTQSHRMVLVDGLPRLGKTNAAKAYCDLHPGRARYFECPSGNDDFSFYREIALSLGVSINLKSKAQELRLRIEETLRGGDLAIVIDQAHYLWPQSHYRNTTPARINWLMALADRGVPVSLISTNQFFLCQKAIEKATCWRSEQFVGRIGHYEKLPDALSPDDLEAVASVMLPGGTTDSIKALVLYAQSSVRYLAAMDAIAARVRFICQSENRQKIEFRDVKRAIQSSVIPSDEALKSAIEGDAQPGRRRVARVVAAQLQGGFQAPALPLPPARNIRPVMPARAGQTEVSHV